MHGKDGDGGYQGLVRLEYVFDRFLYFCITFILSFVYDSMTLNVLIWVHDTIL